MAATTQGAVLGAIEAKLAEVELTLVNDRRYANTGTVYAVAAGSLDAVGHRLTYDFQDYGHVGFRDEVGDYAAAWSKTGGTAPFVAPTLDVLVARVVALLEAR